MFKKNIGISGKVPKSQSTAYGKVELRIPKVVCPPCIGGDSEELMKQLYNSVGVQLKELLTSYSLGRFRELADTLTIEKFNQFSTNIANQSKPTQVYYELTRLLFSKTLDGLMQCVLQYTDLLDTALKLEKCQEKSSILDDNDKLRDYINKLQQQRYLFDVKPLTIIETTIKPEYAEYIKLYGFPENCVFDSNLLAQIIKNLGLE
jgi:hypothetical protein